MQAEQMKQGIDRLERSADEARNACQQSASVPADLKQCVMALHEQASACKHAAHGQGSASEESLRKDVQQLEETADRAMQACRNAGGGVDSRLREAIERAHREASSLKKEMMQAA
ncbi:MAG TPA: hypothetical protein VFM98_15250 [Ramlibacter sp.]|uniref:hypothetical protein n=1 Tax=Ramlibacter sp. TaxID=1917967 RepID=UPI002D7EA8C9|nr:hypothetical protein [Ramlibacter sp.]HET8746961.1 hypothetical protein [Ramlibacter sp.]